jgi:tight adherence protein B
MLGTLALITVTAAVGYGITREWRHAAVRRARALEETQFLQALRSMSQGLKVGAGLRQAIGYAANECPAPMGPRFQRILEELSLGRSLAQATEGFLQGLELPEAKIFCAAIRITQGRGGSLGPVLENLIASMTQKRMLKQKLASLTAQGQASAYLLACVPFLVIAGLFLIAPEMVEPLFLKNEGHGLLSAVFVLVYAGTATAQKIVHPRETF